MASIDLHRSGVDGHARDRQAAFTLIETLLAVAIFAGAIAGPLTLAHVSLRSAEFSENRLTAQYLGQDVLEYIRGYRDTRLNDGVAPEEFLGTLPTQCAEASSYYCSIDTTTGGVPSIEAATNNHATAPYLRRDPVTGRMGYDPTWEQTTFKRTIRFRSGDGYEIAIARLSWEERGVTSTYELSQALYQLP